MLVHPTKRMPMHHGQAWWLQACFFTADSSRLPMYRQVYEPGGLLTDIRDRVKEFMGKHNEEFPAKKVTERISEHARASPI